MALARALAIDPRVLLLDEPFGALDAKVRKELRRWLREIHDHTGHTTVFVTHDQEEALELADRVVVMNDGRIEQVGSADDIYDRPATPFVFDFIGDSSALPVTVDKGHVFLDDRAARARREGSAERAGHAVLPAQPHRAGVRQRTRKVAPGRRCSAPPAASATSRRLELEAGLARHRFEIDVPIDADVHQRGRIAFRISKWRLFPGRANGSPTAA